jgi:hypothetical protein
MAVDLISRPNEKQKLFFQARARHIGYGGARGGGKSWAVRSKAKMLAGRYPGIRILIVRRTYPELTENHIRILRNDLNGIARYNSQEKTLTFVNGSIIKFMYCKNDQDLGAIQGHEYDVIFIDEAAQLSEFQMKAIAVCCRGVNDFPKRIYYTCNPGGQGHAYIKRIFIDRNFLPNENPDDYTFIQALVDDNKALMESQPEYVQLLDSLPYKLREAWRHGRWDVFEGQVFGEFVDDPEHYNDHKWSHVINPFEVPVSWTIYRGYDHGYAKPFSCGWYAISPAGRMYRIRELYGCTGEADVGVEWDVPQIAPKIKEIEHGDPNLQGRHIYGVADTAIFASQSGPSIAEQFAEQQVYFDKSDKNRLPGKMQAHYRLAFNEDGIPMFYVFNTCKNFIRTIPALIYSETDVEDVDTKMEDHIYDEWRYVCMSRPIEPRFKIMPGAWTPPPEDPLDLFS